MDFQIGNAQLEIRNNNRMVDLPRLTKLGAKWVEVKRRRDQGFRSG